MIEGDERRNIGKRVNLEEVLKEVSATVVRCVQRTEEKYIGIEVGSVYKTTTRILVTPTPALGELKALDFNGPLTLQPGDHLQAYIVEGNWEGAGRYEPRERQEVETAHIIVRDNGPEKFNDVYIGALHPFKEVYSRKKLSHSAQEALALFE